MTQKQRNELGVKSLPANLKEALDIMEKDGLVRKVLGEHAYSKFAGSKLKEWDGFRMSVSQWELDKYLFTY